MSKIEMGKTYRTRDGREVRIYAVDHPEPCSVVGAVRQGDGNFYVGHWHPDGSARHAHRDEMDLIEVKPRIKREVWVNVYPDRQAFHDCKGKADHHRSPDAIACIPITIDCEKGEGLE